MESGNQSGISRNLSQPVDLRKFVLPDPVPLAERRRTVSFKGNIQHPHRVPYQCTFSLLYPELSLAEIEMCRSQAEASE